MDSSEAIDKNVPEIVNIKIKWCGMTEPYGRPVTYWLYISIFEDAGELTHWRKNLASECAMKLNGQLYKGVRAPPLYMYVWYLLPVQCYADCTVTSQ